MSRGRTKPRTPARGSRMLRVVAIAAASVAAVAGAALGALYMIGAEHPGLFEPKVRGIEKKYTEDHPTGVVLLTGSSFFERWTTSAADLRPLDTVNVGIGGTKIGDQIAYLDRLVTPFAPRALVMYAGSNDINGLPLFSKTARDVVPRIKEYVALVHERFPELPVYYVAITEAPSRENVRDEIRLANTLLREWAEGSGEIVFIDTAPALLTAAGEIDRQLFGSDRLHFNTEGYARFAPPIREALLRDLAPTD